MKAALKLFVVLIAVTAEIVAGQAPKVWSFKDATVSIRSKGTSVDNAERTETFLPKKPYSGFLNLETKDTLRATLTTTEDDKPARPHQLMLVLREPQSGTEEAFPFKVTPEGKAEIELTQRDLPLQHLLSTRALIARVHVAAFGNAEPLQSFVFFVKVVRDESTPLQIPEKPVRYGKQPEIHHIFKDDPKSPPVFITAVVSMFIIAGLPVLIGTWLTIGLNLDGLFEAFKKAPIAHGLFVGSIVAMEFVFFLYYTTWRLFQMLPVAAVIGCVAFLSGTKALSEVQARRLAGKR